MKHLSGDIVLLLLRLFCVFIIFFWAEVEGGCLKIIKNWNEFIEI